MGKAPNHITHNSKNFRDRECNFKSSSQNSQSQPPTQHIDVWSNNTPAQKSHDDSLYHFDDAVCGADDAVWCMVMCVWCMIFLG